MVFFTQWEDAFWLNHKFGPSLQLVSILSEMYMEHILKCDWGEGFISMDLSSLHLLHLFLIVPKKHNNETILEFLSVLKMHIHEVFVCNYYFCLY